MTVTCEGCWHYSCAAQVVADTMGGHRPEVWISDRYSAQKKHGERHQTCLPLPAHNTASALQHGSDNLLRRFKLCFGNAIDLTKSFYASTLGRKRRELEKQLEALLTVPSTCNLAQALP
jgi:transposase